MFKLWSEKNSKANKLLTPSLGLKKWSKLSREEKEKIWCYINNWFSMDDRGRNLRVFLSIYKLNNLHKYQSYAKSFLKDRSFHNASSDFKDIFFEQDQHVVLELLSCFCSVILQERQNEHSRIYRNDYKSEKEYKKRLIAWRHEEFDKFAEELNNTFEHFGINLFLTRAGFIERQDSKITNGIYVPVLNFLSLSEWNNVSREFGDAFKEYQLKTKHGYSNCVTHAVSALQAYLQILVNGKIGSGNGINNLIKQAQEKELIPDDKFSSEIFKNVDAILMRERGKTGNAHPKKEYANEKSARLVLNLVMVFLQHCIQYK